MRPIWTGAISFGLIHIPVRLYVAVQERRLDLDMLHKRDLSPIRYVRVCQADGQEVPFREIVKGYKYQKGDYVVLKEEDFKRADVRKTQTIEIQDFVSAEEIDLKLLEKPYYLEPVKEARKAFALLREALHRTRRVGVAKFVLRTREHLAILKAEEEMLILEQMRFESEIRKPAGLDLPKKDEVSARELEMAVKLVEQLTRPFHPEEYRDTYLEELRRVIDEKAQGKVPKPKGEKPIPTGIPDLMAKLRESLEYAQSRRPPAQA